HNATLAEPGSVFEPGSRVSRAFEAANSRTWFNERTRFGPQASFGTLARGTNSRFSARPPTGDSGFCDARRSQNVIRSALRRRRRVESGGDPLPDRAQLRVLVSAVDESKADHEHRDDLP